MKVFLKENSLEVEELLGQSIEVAPTVPLFPVMPVSHQGLRSRVVTFSVGKINQAERKRKTWLHRRPAISTVVPWVGQWQQDPAFTGDFCLHSYLKTKRQIANKETILRHIRSICEKGGLREEKILSFLRKTVSA